MTEVQAIVLALFFSALGFPAKQRQIRSGGVPNKWAVQVGLYSIHEWPVDAIDNLFWSHPHQEIVGPLQAEQA